MIAARYGDALSWSSWISVLLVGGYLSDISGFQEVTLEKAASVGVELLPPFTRKYQA